ncbi:hypothetical protein [Aestuariirhabdus litorea]|uniref:Uncharacterized protein n=1 Tax=Aestuariirhabdus litorea TaxID=2528527 RepID=A0A3P3VKL1_9GAMM|nr:hypothetical protein [Aestuariirhabdus litorea]RRJ83281.1 hypothetical protein D0544_15770 [Aestuariirhabdus litorea]RWW93440.1 hypothetical protein DZC74_15740 [Endozoicomonadaceae bacterium GTF-13]
MLEQQRQQYLSAMGVQPWFARKRLPCAKPSTRCAWIWDQSSRPQPQAGATASPLPNPMPDTAAEPRYAPQLSAPAGAPQARPPASPRGGKEALAALKQSAQAPVAPKPKVAPPLVVAPPDADAPRVETEGVATDLEPPAAVEVPRCRLEIIALSDRHWVIADLPHSEVGGFTRFHQQLLQDIARSIGWPLDPQERKGFHWPLVDNGAIDQGIGVARDTLVHWLQQDERWNRCTRLMLLGPQAISLLLDEHQEPGQVVTQGERTLLLCHSLNALMKLPELKRETWHALRGYLQTTRES